MAVEARKTTIVDGHDSQTLPSRNESCHARHIDPTPAQRYYRLVTVEGKHHNSALCSVSAVLITRIAACWRKGELY